MFSYGLRLVEHDSEVSFVLKPVQQRKSNFKINSKNLVFRCIAQISVIFNGFLLISNTIRYKKYYSIIFIVLNLQIV